MVDEIGRDGGAAEAVPNTRVLIVEDEPAIASVIERTLAAAGLRADIAENGLDGLWRAREGSYGVMLLDILLPQMNGYEVCRTLRAEGNPIAILMLTAKAGEYDETDGLELGADDYLRKPFSSSVLVARVNALLRRIPGTQLASTLECGELHFDVAARRCRLGRDPVALTPREAAVLEVLLRSGATPLTRQELLDKVWGMDFDGDPNVVDVYLGYLRKKIGKARIENIRNVGFRVRP